MHMTKYDRAYLIDIVTIVTSFVIARRERETYDGKWDSAGRKTLVKRR